MWRSARSPRISPLTVRDCLLCWSGVHFEFAESLAREILRKSWVQSFKHARRTLRGSKTPSQLRKEQERKLQVAIKAGNKVACVLVCAAEPPVRRVVAALVAAP